MKIAMFTDTYFPQISGVATSIKILTDELRNMGHEVVIFTTTDPNVKEGEDENGVIRIMSMPFLFFSDRRMVIGGMHKAYKIAKREKFDIVHTHTEFGMGLIGKYVAYRLKIPTIHTYHTMYEKYLHYIAKGTLLKPAHVKSISYYFCNQTSGVIAPGQPMKDTLLSYDINSEIRVIPTGVTVPELSPILKQDMRMALNLEQSELILLSLCRLAREKSLDKLILALPDVLKNYPTAMLVFVGDGPVKDELIDLVERLQLTKNVKFVGEIAHDDVFKYYQMADIYINASETETQGLTYLEALVNGLPIIAKKNSYLSSLITSPLLGCLFERTYDLSETIVNYANALESYSKQSANKAELLYNVSSQKFAKEVYKFYEDAITSYHQQKSNMKNPITKFLNKIDVLDKLYK